MIHERRQTHFWSFVALACILPLGFLASLLLRPSYGPAASSSTSLFDNAGFTPSVTPDEIEVLKQVDWADAVVPIKGEAIKVTEAGAPQVLLAVTPSRAIQQPDVLVYWQEGKQASTDALAENALFLGSLVGTSRRAFTVPTAMQGKAGNLLIYSQGKDSVLSALPLSADMTTP